MNEFHFLRPWWFLALLPALWLIWLLIRVRSGFSQWRTVCDPAFLNRLWLEKPGAVSRLPIILLGLGWFIAVFALAGPVWERQPQPLFRTQSARVLVLDLSPSMEAKDITPSRLTRSRFKITDILRRTQEGKIALVVFGGEPYLVTPLTDDTATIGNFLPALTPNIIPVVGDSGAPALRMAGELLARAGVNAGDVLMITDGVVDDAAVLGTARWLRDQGHRLSVLAVGTQTGAPVPGQGGDFTRMARLDLDPLQALARAGQGGFSLLTVDDRDLTRVLPSAVNPDAILEEQQGGGVERWVEQGVWLTLLLLPLAALGFRRGWLMGLGLLIILTPPPILAWEWSNLWLRPDQRGARILDRGQPQQAAQQFQDPSWRGMALYQTGDYAAAAEAFAQGQGADAHYNRGNALARAGELEQAVTAYRQALELEPDHQDAQANLELLERLLQQPPDDASSSSPNPETGEDKDSSSQNQDSQPAEDNSNQSGQDSAETQTEPARQSADNPPSPSPQQQSANQTSDSQPAEDNRMDVTEQARQEQQPQAIPQDPPLVDDGDDPTSLSSPMDQPPSEADIALEQWLRQIPEDPAGLLRRKFLLEHLRRSQTEERP